MVYPPESRMILQDMEIPNQLELISQPTDQTFGQHGRLSDDALLSKRVGAAGKITMLPPEILEQ